jgi:membrane protease YdiL (CAAX protease family)
MKTELFGSVRADQRQTWILAVPVLVFVFFIGGQLLVLLPIKILGLASRETIETYPTILFLIIGAFGMAAILFIAWLRLFERRSLASAGLASGGSAPMQYVRAYGLGLFMAAAVVLCVLLLGGYELESAVDMRFGDLVPITVLMLAFALQSGTEELIFRGWMMARIAARYGLWAGVLGNSVLFTLMHVDSEALVALGWTGIVIFVAGTMLFSIFLSLLVIREKSVWGAAAWHAAWNWIFITGFGLPTTGIELNLVPLFSDLAPIAGAPVWLTGGTDGPEGSFITPVVLAFGCLWLIRTMRRPAA